MLLPRVLFSVDYKFILALLVCTQLTAQTLNKPVPGSSGFSHACASSTFNQFFFEFSWSAPLVNTGNDFILELSDASGNFGAPVTLSSLNDKNTTFTFDFEFAFPTDTAGDNYKVRVRSTDPELTSPESDPFSAYYQSVTSPLSINNLVSPVFSCDGDPVTLSVNNFPSEPTYEWYRNTSLIAGETGSSISVTQSGMYYAQVDYGLNCSGSTASNIVDVTIISSGGSTVSIDGASTIDLCSPNSQLLQAAPNDPTGTYTWYKDGAAITSPTTGDSSYTVMGSTPGFEGDYTVEYMPSGGCPDVSDAVTINSQSDFSITPDTTTYLIVPGATNNISVSTTADTPTYQWYRDGIIVAGGTTNTLPVTLDGNYHATVTQGGSCVANKDSDIIEVYTMSSFDLTIAPGSGYSDCTLPSTNLEVSGISANTSGGAFDATAQLTPLLIYQWQLDSSDISGATSSTFTANNPDSNSLPYSLNATAGSLAGTSNNLIVKVTPSDTISISTTSTVLCDGNTTDLGLDTTDPGYTYAWYRNSTLLTETSDILNTNLSGTYLLEVTTNGCVIESNEVIVTDFDPSVVSLDTDTTVQLAEGGSQPVTASGADSYQWLDASNMELSTDATYTITQEGIYNLRAHLGSCSTTITITAELLESFNIPNVITPNSDGINDLWVIPNVYSFQDNVEVHIISYTGKTVIQTTAYQNNWPDSSFATLTARPVYYYRISRQNEVLKQGTITIIK